MFEIFQEKSHWQKNDKTERARGLGSKTRGDTKGKSNDSPDISDSGDTLDINGLPFGGLTAGAWGPHTSISSPSPVKLNTSSHVCYEVNT